MAAGQRIAEVARRTGFTPATLRYYEEIGLLPPPRRSDGGYRMYDDDVVIDRLAFIARAKQLGCTLEEIADLSTAWDGGECGPVQVRLSALVAAKLAETHGRIAELATFGADLRTAATSLERHRPDGPCDDRCGCITAPATSDDAAIACTLNAEAMPGRWREWQELQGFVTTRSPLTDGLRLEFDPSVPIAELVGLCAAEHDCCRFFAFAVTIDGRGVGLEVRVPPDGLPIAVALFGGSTVE
jgi:MerR family transcriptional regulator, copper efflux regulator